MRRMRGILFKELAEKQKEERLFTKEKAGGFRA